MDEAPPLRSVIFSSIIRLNEGASKRESRMNGRSKTKRSTAEPQRNKMRLRRSVFTKRTVSGNEKRPPTLYEQLKPVIGKAEGLPPDAAEMHDHYLYGLPRQ